MSDLEIRHATREDADSLQAFIRSAYSSEAHWKRAERWRWQFIENPEAKADVELPTVIAKNQQEIIGQIAVEPCRLWLGKLAVQAGWIVDVMVLPAYRGRGLGHSLQSPIPAKIAVALTLTMAPATRKIGLRAGAIELAPVHQYCLFQVVRADDVRRFVDRKLMAARGSKKLIASLVRAWGASHLTAFACRLLGGVQRIRAQRRPGLAVGFTICETDRFGEEYDELADQLRASYALSVGRGSGWMKWRFLDSPDLSYTVAEAREDGRLLGYVAYRKYRTEESRGGAIVDLVVAHGRSDVADALARHAVASLGECAFIEVGASAPSLCELFRSLGFFRRRTHHPTALVANEQLRFQLSRAVGSMFLTKADHDWDQVRSVDT